LLTYWRILYNQRHDAICVCTAHDTNIRKGAHSFDNKAPPQNSPHSQKPSTRNDAHHSWRRLQDTTTCGRPKGRDTISLNTAHGTNTAFMHREFLLPPADRSTKAYMYTEKHVHRERASLLIGRRPAFNASLVRPSVRTARRTFRKRVSWTATCRALAAPKAAAHHPPAHSAPHASRNHTL